MTNDPKISAGIDILRKAFERAAIEYDYQSPKDPEVMEQSTLTLAEVLPDISVSGDLDTGVKLSFEFKTPAGDKRSGELEIDDQLLIDANREGWKPLLNSQNDIQTLKDAISYRRNAYGFG